MKFYQINKKEKNITNNFNKILINKINKILINSISKNIHKITNNKIFIKIINITSNNNPHFQMFNIKII